MENNTDGFFNTLAGIGILLMGLAVFGLIFEGFSAATPTDNRATEINSTIKQTGLINLNFGDAKGENRND